MTNKRFHAVSCAVFATVLAGGTCAAEAVRRSFDLQVMNAPAAVDSPIGRQLVYELHVTNFASEALTLIAVEALDAASGKVIGALRDKALETGLGRLGHAVSDQPRRTVEPGMRAIVYLSVPAGDEVRVLRHRVEFEAGDMSEPRTIEGGETSVDELPLARLGPPLRCGPWAAVFNPAWERGHRRVFYAVDGKARLPGRFAIDWMRARAPVSSEQSDGHGADVLAVADARVVAARGDFKQPEDKRAVIPLEDGSGNYVTLDLGGGRYAFYEHMAEGLRVKVGDSVRTGDVIGALGATGHVTHPHLHFHVADANASLAAEGLPYALMNFRALGEYDSIEDFQNGKRWRAYTDDRPRSGYSFPSPMMVVEFPCSDAA